MADTRSEVLSRLVLDHLMPSFELDRADIAQCRMSSLTIIKHLDVFENILFRLFSCLIILAINPLGLQAPEKTFHHRIVPTIAFAAHNAHNSQIAQNLLISIRGILHAAITMMQNPVAGERCVTAICNADFTNPVSIRSLITPCISEGWDWSIISCHNAGFGLYCWGRINRGRVMSERMEIELFDNPNPERDYSITIECPEFTSVCPKTGQPDFGEIVIEYIPDKSCIELKSLKFYMQGYRNKGIFYEALTNDILDDLIAACKPRWMKVTSRFTPRGGITTRIVAEYEAEKESRS